MDTNKLSLNNNDFQYKRDASFDFCFNYFQSFKEENNLDQIVNNMEYSCLQLGYYLASWGMLRNSFLLNNSVKCFEPLLSELVVFDSKIWSIDIDNYTEENFEVLLKFKELILEKFEGKPTDTLITKIMLGIFGNVPALDTYFCTSSNVYSLTPKACNKLIDFYELHKKSIQNSLINTTDFQGNKTHRLYTKAKLIDMIGFNEGIKTKNASHVSN